MPAGVAVPPLLSKEGGEGGHRVGIKGTRADFAIRCNAASAQDYPSRAIYSHKRRIKTLEKAKNVAALWGTEFI